MSKLSLKIKIGFVLLGIVSSFILLEIGLRLGGGIILFMQEHRNRQLLKERDSYTIICLGGSTTATGGKDSYPTQLNEILNKNNIGIKFTVINKGLSSCNSDFILLNLNNNLNRYDPDMVIVMMGVNDENIGCVPYQNILEGRKPDDIGYIPYQKQYKSSILSFFKSFRVYKLINLIFAHSRAKIEENKADFNIESHSDVFVEQDESLEVNILQEKWHESMDELNFEKAQELVKTMIKLAPERKEYYLFLLDTYVQEDNYEEADLLLKKLPEVYKECYEEPFALYQLGFVYGRKNDFVRAEEFLKKGIDIHPLYREPYGELARIYRECNEIYKLEEVCEKIVDRGLESGDLYGFLATSCYEIGQYKKAKKYYKKANEFRMNNYRKMTRYNYQQLKDIVIERDLKLVCVQYPMRNVEALKKMLGVKKGVIFVDNENLFKWALKYGKYEDYFEDNFAGDFGHCTRLGNQLLAANIANAILKECFKVDSF